VNEAQAQQVEELFFCPDCSSAGVTTVDVAGTASCNGCDWTGRIEQLAVVPVPKGQSDTFTLQLVNDLRKLLAKDMGLEFLKFFGRWGFLKFDPNNVAGTINRKQFSRYLAAVARGIATSLFEERAKIEQEKVRSSMENN
jgi:hypothetical protein